MGRPERDIDGSAGPVQRFAVALRTLRDSAGRPSYRRMSQIAHYSVTTLSDAAGGELFPSLPVTLAYVTACGGDTAEWEKRWRSTEAETRAQAAADNRGDDDTSCPYVGLAAFQTADAERFFGRDRVTDDLLVRVGEHRFLGVFGPSGSGKSSVLRAGLAARAATQGVAGNGGQPVLVLTPGPHPLEECAVVLAAESGASAAVVRTELASATESLHLRIRQFLAAAPDGVELLLIVDQFEEVFTLCTSHVERDAFIAALLYAAATATSRTRVVVGVRADFYAHCGQYPDLVGALNDAQVLIGPMSPDELADVVVLPARAAGYVCDTNLVAQLVAEAASQACALPLLSHVLVETWRRRRGMRLTLAGYEATGGILHAIARTAEDLYTRLDPAQQQATRRILLRLIAPTDGADTATKRRAARSEIHTGDPDAAAVLETLATSRLLTLDNDTVELAHEALIDHWPRLQAWLDHDRDGLRLHRELGQRARAWDRHDRDPGSLYAGVELELTRRWAATHTEELDPIEHDFYRASLAAEHARHTAARSRQRSRRRQLRILAGLLVIAVVAGLVAWQQRTHAVQQQHTAEAARRTALSRQLAAQSTALINVNPDLASLLAVEAYHLDPTDEARQALVAPARLPLKHRLAGHNDATGSVAFSPDGATLATASLDRTVRLWNPYTGQPVATLTGHAAAVVAVAFSPDGSTLATGSDDGTARLWNAHTGRAIATLPGDAGGVFAAAFSADGGVLATASQVGTVRLWNAHTGRLITTFTGQAGADFAMALNPDGTTLATATDDGTARLWNVHTRRLIATLTGHAGAVVAVAFSPDSATLATGSKDHTARLWDAHTGRPLATLTGHTDQVWAVAFSPDSGTLATRGIDRTARLWNTRTGRPVATLTGADNTSAVGLTAMRFSPDSATFAAAVGHAAELWNARTGKPITTFNGHADDVWGVAFSPDGATLATGSVDHTVRLWNAHSAQPTATLTGHSASLNTVAFGPDGAVLATTGNGPAVRLWNLNSGHLIRIFGGHTHAATAAVLSPEGTVLATTGDDHTVRLWNTRTGRPIAALPDRGGPIEFSPDGATIAAFGLDHTVRLSNAHTGHPVATLAGHTNNGLAMAFSVDGATLATASTDRTARRWNLRTLQSTSTIPIDVEDPRRLAVAFSPDDATAAIGNSTGTIVLWNTHTGQYFLLHRQTPGRTSAINTVAFSPDGTLFAAGSSDHTVRLWNTRTLQPIATFIGHTGAVRALAFSADSTTLASGDDDDTVRLWNTHALQPIAALTGPTGAIRALAFSPDGAALVSSGNTTLLWPAIPPENRRVNIICAALTRALTRQEWSQYLPNQPYDPQCLR